MTTGTGCPVETEGIETRTAEAADIPNMSANAETEEIGAPGMENMMLSRKQTSETSKKKENTVDSLAFYLLACQGKPLSKRHIDRILQLVQADDYSLDECHKRFHNSESLRKYVEDQDTEFLHGCGFKQVTISISQDSNTASIWTRDAASVLQSLVADAGECDIIWSL